VTLLTREWANRVARRAADDPEYRRSGRAFTGSVLLYDEESSVTIRCDRGSVIEIQDREDPRGVTFRLGGPRAGWNLALSNARDLGAATDRLFGGLVLTGDYVALAASAKVLMRLWIAMIGVAAADRADS
jgi:hypothetical protein